MDPSFSLSRADTCAEIILETTPVLMQGLRTLFRGAHPEKLSVAQFRTLLFIRENPGCPLHELSDHLDISKSAASGVMRRLEEYGLARVEQGEGDRRRVALRVTEEGRMLVEGFKESVRSRLGLRLSSLSGEELELLMAAFSVMRDFFRRQTKS